MDKTPLETLTAWLEREVPPGTIISTPKWWAPKILAVVERSVAAAEREACAKVCEDLDATTGECPELAKYCADAIRKRGAL